MSCEDLDLTLVSDSDYVKNSFTLYLNNEPKKAIDLLEKLKEKSLTIMYAYIFLHVVEALISFDKRKIYEASALLRELEKRIILEQNREKSGWISTIKSKLFKNRPRCSDKRSILEEIDREIVYADTLLCTATLNVTDFEVSSYIKAAFNLRKAWKIYNQTFKKINDLCNEHFPGESPFDLGKLLLILFQNKYFNMIYLPFQDPLKNSCHFQVQFRNVVHHLQCLYRHREIILTCHTIICYRNLNQRFSLKKRLVQKV